MAAQRPIFDPTRMAAKEDANLAPRSLTVSQLNALVKRVLGTGLPATIHLVGQISNVSRPTSGHLYFTLKDERSEVRAVMWRSSAVGLKFEIEDGMEVVATGSVDVYEPRGQYQFYVRKLEPKGVGNLELAFRQLYERLAKEGLFDAARKKKIPRYPRRIGVVTSPSGAAIHDILHTLRRRFPCAEVFLYPVRVQGEGAAAEIAGAVRTLNARAGELGGLDLLIVGRGGGSLEDLWAFNEEIVARAIAASRIPVIAGVGHEVDVTIADLVADLRAPTPTAAAELAVPLLSEVLEGLLESESRLRQCMRHHLELARSRLDAIQRAEIFRAPAAVVRRKEQQVDELAGALGHAVHQAISRVQRRLSDLQVRLVSVRPAVLVRDQQARLARIDHRLQAVIHRRCREAERRIDTLGRLLQRVSPSARLGMESEKIRQYQLRLHRGVMQRLSFLRARTESLTDRLEAISYRRTLARGYSVTWDERRERIIRSAAEIRPGDVVITETADGEFRSRAEE
ncbi:MAG TPA: exodeoxyribonuclease VII large subunit [Phycisphaerae bacterium]|nr:exodeoxyribonuclease VII large subunit [Phycisphaerae bacterium]HPP27575.1 exodeoxyribonuclease VII large subunit [Phycisphaerae bacterium]